MSLSPSSNSLYRLKKRRTPLEFSSDLCFNGHASLKKRTLNRILIILRRPTMAVLVGRQAPDFVAKAVVNGDIKQDFKLTDFRGKYVLLFFYPLDFTFVCPTEIHAFQE